MKYFLDTEFNQTVDPVELISLGIVAEDGREFYGTAAGFREEACDDWLKTNVLPALDILPPNFRFDPMDSSKSRYCPKATLSVMRTYLENFIGIDRDIEFWGYYADYDWYLFTRFWGFMNMPKHFPKLCFDIKQYQHQLEGIKGKITLPKAFKPEHHALVDARWNKHAYEFLQKIEFPSEIR